MEFRQRQRLTLFSLVLLLFCFALVPAVIRAQEEDDATLSVQFAGHSFTLPRGIADGIAAYSIAQPTASLNGGDALQPPRTEFRLLTYTDTFETPPAAGWVSVYNAADLQGYAASEQYERLRALLSERLSLNDQEMLPTLYPYQQSFLPPDRYTELFVNAAYLEAEGYHGITFIYGRVLHLGSSQPVLFYRIYFEGLSSDDQRYLSAQVEGLPELTASLEGITDVDEYVSGVRALFDEPTDAAVIAWVRQANEMFSSFDYSLQP